MQAFSRLAKGCIEKASCLSAGRRGYIPAGLTAASLRPTPVDSHETCSACGVVITECGHEVGY
jgi:hypothetical protein